MNILFGRKLFIHSSNFVTSRTENKITEKNGAQKPLEKGFENIPFYVCKFLRFLSSVILKNVITQFQTTEIDKTENSTAALTTDHKID